MLTMKVPQDLHIHTIYSTGDGSVVEQQTVELVARVDHAERIGISDHFEYLYDGLFAEYESTVRSHGLLLGTEVDGGSWTRLAAGFPVDYFVYHCRDTEKDYLGLHELLETGKPVIVAHPHMMGTDFDRLPDEAIIEINNRYIWQCDWIETYGPVRNRFRFVISSDAHQPNWLDQNVARRAAEELGIEEYLMEDYFLMDDRFKPALV